MLPTMKVLKCEQIKERKVVELEVLSPLHIGGREGMLNALDYVCYQGMTHVIDEERFGAFLHKNAAIDRFVDSIRNGEWNLSKFISQECGNPNLKSLLPRITKYPVSGGKANMQFRPFARDGNGQVYLPGTSIKGTLRTAFLLSLLHQNTSSEKKIQEIVNLQIDGVKSNRDKAHFSSKWLNEDSLQCFTLTRNEQTKPGPNRDIFRSLTVRDAYPVGSMKSEIIKVQFLSKNSTGFFAWSNKKSKGIDTGKPLEIWLEAITQGRFRAEILFDREIFSLFDHSQLPLNSENGLSFFLESAFSMSSRLIEHEKEYLSVNGKMDQNAHMAAASLDKWYGCQGGDLLRIGFGSGILGTSIGLLFDEKTRQRVRNKCGHNRGDAPAPKTRRIWHKDEKTWLPLGWLKAVETDEELVLSTPQKAQPVRHIWEKASLSWKPNETSVYVSSGTLRAFVKGKSTIEMKEIVPEALRKNLFERRKPVTAKVEVEAVGNAFKIIRIDPVDS